MYVLPLGAFQVKLVLPVNVSVTFEFDDEKVPPNLPVKLTVSLAPEALSVNVRLTFQAPLVVSVSGLVGDAVLETRRFVTTTSELFVALFVGSLVNETVPLPESEETNDWLGVKL